MNSNLASQYLMRSLAMNRKKVAGLRERVEAGKCIIEGCDLPLRSRGLCQKHKQQYYQELRKLPGDTERLQFKEDCVRDGLILPSGEQAKWTTKNPFAKAAS